MAPLLSWYLKSQILSSSLQFKFAQYYTWLMKNIAQQYSNIALRMALLKIDIWEGKSSVSWSKIAFYGGALADDNFEESYPLNKGQWFAFIHIY